MISTDPTGASNGLCPGSRSCSSSSSQCRSLIGATRRLMSLMKWRRLDFLSYCTAVLVNINHGWFSSLHEMQITNGITGYKHQARNPPPHPKNCDRFEGEGSVVVSRLKRWLPSAHALVPYQTNNRCASNRSLGVIASSLHDQEMFGDCLGLSIAEP